MLYRSNKICESESKVFFSSARSLFLISTRSHKFFPRLHGAGEVLLRVDLDVKALQADGALVGEFVEVAQ